MTIKKYLSTIEDLSDRKIALTGGTSGIGLALLKHLVSKNAYVILLARNLEKAKAVVDSLNYSKIDVIYYDQSSFKLIENGIDDLLEKHPDVDTYVLNAGELSKKRLTAEGYSLTIGVNYFGTRHFIEYISPKLTRKSKFVVQGSIVAGLHLSKKADPTSTKYGMFKQYNISKIYLEAYIHKLMKEHSNPLIDYVLTEPGVTPTNVTRHMNAFMRYGGKVFLPIVVHKPKKASLTLLKGISEVSKNGDYLRPRGYFTLTGYPKYKKFPLKREREFLFK